MSNYIWMCMLLALPLGLQGSEPGWSLVDEELYSDDGVLVLIENDPTLVRTEKEVTLPQDLPSRMIHLTPLSEKFDYSTLSTKERSLIPILSLIPSKKELEPNPETVDQELTLPKFLAAQDRRGNLRVGVPGIRKIGTYPLRELLERIK